MTTIDAGDRGLGRPTVWPRDMMPRPTGLRPLGLADIMALTAASALGFLAVRQMMGQSPILSLWQPDRAIHWVGRACLVWPVVACWMIALVVLRLRRPRPPLPFAQPGPAACLVVAALVVWKLAGLAFFGLIWGLQPGGAVTVLCGVDAPTTAGAGIAAAWIALAASGRRERADWIDALGRALGVFCLLFFLGRSGYEVHRVRVPKVSAPLTRGVPSASLLPAPVHPIVYVGR